MRLRRQLGLAARRLRRGLWSIGQISVGVGLAWLAATTLLGHPSPFFACVAVVVCLGLRAAQRLRRVIELAVGVTLGVAVGDALVSRIGAGAWQLSVVVGVALVLAVLLDGGPLVSAQAGLQAVFVVALPGGPGAELARWEDAMLGGATALLVAAVLPAQPWRDARTAGAAVLTEVATVVEASAAAVRAHDPAAAGASLTAGRATQPGLDAWAAALGTGHDISQLSPLRRDVDHVWERQSRLAAGVDRATRNLRVLVRRLLFALNNVEALPVLLPELLDELAAALRLLAGAAAAGDSGPVAAATTQLLALAARLDPDALEVQGLSGSVAVAQLRAAVVDLLEGVGLAPDAARSALPA